MGAPTKSGAQLSVVLVTHNSAHVLLRCLSSLSQHLPGAEVIVVDNGSTDDSAAVAATHPGVRVIRGHGNVGFGAGVNLGAAAATADLLLVLNPDVIVVHVDDGALRALAASPAVGLRACRQTGQGLGQHAVFPAWRWQTELSWWMCAWFLLPRELPQPRPRARRTRTRWINGSAFMARRAELLAAGGFDESFFLYFEDFDLSRTYRRRGLPVDETDAVAVVHRRAQSSPRDEERMIALALLGLIEVAAKEGDGVAAAARSLLLLRRLVLAGRRIGRLPAIGPRARRKATSAEAVLRLLSGAAVSDLADGRYRRARQALQAGSRRS